MTRLNMMTGDILERFANYIRVKQSEFNANNVTKKEIRQKNCYLYLISGKSAYRNYNLPENLAHELVYHFSVMTVDQIIQKYNDYFSPENSLHVSENVHPFEGMTMDDIIQLLADIKEYAYSTYDVSIKIEIKI